MQKLRYLFENIFIQIAGVSGILFGPIVDALGGGIWFWYLSGGLSFFFILGIITELQKHNRLSIETIHIPLVIKIDDGPDSKLIMNQLIRRIEEKNHFSNYKLILQKYLKINIDDFIFEYNGSIYDFECLMNFTRIIKYCTTKLEHQLNGRVKLHIAYYRRPSIGFLLGTIFRTEGAFIYQNNDSENEFYAIANIENRNYKTSVESFSKYRISYELQNNNNDEVLILLESSSHAIALQSSNLCQYQNIVKIKLLEGSTIPYNTDWIPYAREIYTILNHMQTRYKKIILAHAMPEALAIILGMALENYWQIDILQYENQQYKYIYNMSQIKYY